MTSWALTVGDIVDADDQLITISAVLLGALTTHLTSYMMERQRNRHELATRWDAAKLDAYVAYVDQVRAGIFAAVHLYEHRTGIKPSEKSDQELATEMSEVGRERGRCFERVLMLGGDNVVESAHELNAKALEVDWQATGKVEDSLEDWRERNRAAFTAVNAFHDASRTDLGVRGSVTGAGHPDRDLLLPPARRGEDRSPDR